MDDQGHASLWECICAFGKDMVAFRDHPASLTMETHVRVYQVMQMVLQTVQTELGVRENVVMSKLHGESWRTDVAVNGSKLLARVQEPHCTGQVICRVPTDCSTITCLRAYKDMGHTVFPGSTELVSADGVSVRPSAMVAHNIGVCNPLEGKQIHRGVDTEAKGRLRANRHQWDPSLSMLGEEANKDPCYFVSPPCDLQYRHLNIKNSVSVVEEEQEPHLQRPRKRVRSEFTTQYNRNRLQQMDATSMILMQMEWQDSHAKTVKAAETKLPDHIYIGERLLHGKYNSTMIYNPLTGCYDLIATQPLEADDILYIQPLYCDVVAKQLDEKNCNAQQHQHMSNWRRYVSSVAGCYGNQQFDPTECTFFNPMEGDNIKYGVPKDTLFRDVRHMSPGHALLQKFRAHFAQKQLDLTQQLMMSDGMINPLLKWYWDVVHRFSRDPLDALWHGPSTTTKSEMSVYAGIYRESSDCPTVRRVRTTIKLVKQNFKYKQDRQRTAAAAEAALKTQEEEAAVLRMRQQQKSARSSRRPSTSNSNSCSNGGLPMQLSEVAAFMEDDVDPTAAVCPESYIEEDGLMFSSTVEQHDIFKELLEFTYN